jgi:hypothetical protein
VILKDPRSGGLRGRSFSYLLLATRWSEEIIRPNAGPFWIALLREPAPKEIAW